MLRLGVEFTTLSPNIDETSRANETAIELVTRLAEAKYNAVASKTKDEAIIICSDQVLSEPEFGSTTIIGKPRDHEEARVILNDCMGKTFAFRTSLIMVNTRTQKSYTALQSTKVTFQHLSKETIDQYIRLTRPFFAAGGIVSESIGIAMFESIQANDPTAILGLPLIDLCKGLSKLHKPIWQLQTNKRDPN